MKNCCNNRNYDEGIYVITRIYAKILYAKQGQGIAFNVGPYMYA